MFGLAVNERSALIHVLPVTSGRLCKLHLTRQCGSGYISIRLRVACTIRAVTKSKLTIIIAGAVIAVAVIVCGIALLVPSSPKTANTPAAPVASPTPTQTNPDQLAEVPGGYCATNRLGKTIVVDGKTYTCQAPKPYRWRS